MQSIVSTLAGINDLRHCSQRWWRMLSHLSIHTLMTRCESAFTIPKSRTWILGWERVGPRAGQSYYTYTYQTAWQLHGARMCNYCTDLNNTHCTCLMKLGLFPKVWSFQCRESEYSHIDVLADIYNLYNRGKVLTYQSKRTILERISDDKVWSVACKLYHTRV